jgi:hypothetical protein
MKTPGMLKFMMVFGRNLEGRLEKEIVLNADHIAKIELASRSLEEVSSIITLTTGEKLEVAGTPEDLVTHERYFYPKAEGAAGYHAK